MKMVYKFAGGSKNYLVNRPKDYEVVTVSQCPVYSDSYDVLEYLKNIRGNPQSIEKRHFRPLSDVLAEISISELLEEVVEC